MKQMPQLPYQLPSGRCALRMYSMPLRVVSLPSSQPCAGGGQDVLDVLRTILGVLDLEDRERSETGGGALGVAVLDHDVACILVRPGVAKERTYQTPQRD